ncbi:hypothetical protein NHX12_001405 [Muraenolepis orangiensis]|uniref:Integrin beta N-terminal domain-containing protein n=1 Tax=Muraenolepis orangiensis TaxID=630683 RepID=A0A9Q0DYD6_9TELE|nr:hypothetical protein NHX12_001405 [Muraenolepis orangiensis]
MELRLSVLLSVLLLGLVCPNWAHKGRCPHKQTCDKCIQAGPECAWCTQLDITVPRCNTEDKLVKGGCDGHIYNPKGGLRSITNESRTQADQPVQATLVQLALRPGVVQSVLVTLPKVQEKTPELTLETSPVPEHVNITFNDTANPWIKQVNVEATRCTHGNGSWTVTITPTGYALLLELQLTVECACECTKGRQENSPACGGRGSLECGRCACSAPYTGGRCQKGGPEPTPGDEGCRPAPGGPVCSGRGTCEDGYCNCGPARRYTGVYCQCSDFDCPLANSRY